MKKYPIQINVGLLMLMAVLLLLATGYLSYRNLAFIVSSIHVDERPELRLLTIREISMDIEKAENSIRLFTITKNTKDLEPYYAFITNIDGKMNRLRSECSNDSVLLEHTESISRYIEENILNWNELIYLINKNTVVDYLKKLSEQISGEIENQEEKDKGILRRVLSRSNKRQLDEQEIIDKLQKIEQLESINKETLKAKESQISSTGIKIKSRLYDLITIMENEVYGLIQHKALAASTLAKKTYQWLIMFSISGMLLALIVILIIIKYVRKTQAYQVALENSKIEAEKLARTKEMFMANVSHEIRTPLTAISGFTEQLLNELSDKNITQTLNIIKSSSDHLIRIINDILDFSKLQSDKIVLEKIHFRLKELLEEIYMMFEKEATRNNNTLSYLLSPDTPPIIIGDSYRLKQILINLISNAVKFTNDGKIHLIVDSIIKQEGEIELIISVIDTGIGIEESKLEFIFEDFTQEEMNTTRNYGGTGLGLSIVKKLIEIQQGTIECKSRKNHGTKITLRIPYMIGDEQQLKGKISSALLIPEKIKQLKILIVDDEEYNRLLFKKIFDRWEIKYNEAENATEAFKVLKTNQYDLLFMDIRMPGLDGLKATQIIRKEMKIKSSEMPMICISAVTVSEEWGKYEKAGMNAFLQKPFTEESLLQVILSVTEDMAFNKIIDNTKNEKESASFYRDKINLNNLHHISGGDLNFVKQMIVVFIKTTEKGLKDLHQAVTTGKTENIIHLAHKMLPSCRHIGAKEMYNILKRIEESALNKDKNKLYELIMEVIKEFELVRELLGREISDIR